MRFLSCVQQLVADHVLGPGELLAADITGVFVVILGTRTTNISSHHRAQLSHHSIPVSLHMLGELADLPELFAALLAGVELLLSEAHRLVVLPRLVS